MIGCLACSTVPAVLPRRLTDETRLRVPPNLSARKGEFSICVASEASHPRFIVESSSSIMLFAGYLPLEPNRIHASDIHRRHFTDYPLLPCTF